MVPIKDAEKTVDVFSAFLIAGQFFSGVKNFAWEILLKYILTRKGK